MEKQSLFETTVNDLLKAYNSGNLKHDVIDQCAVGTILTRYIKKGEQAVSWASLFITPFDEQGKPMQQLIAGDDQIIAMKEQTRFEEDGIHQEGTFVVVDMNKLDENERAAAISSLKEAHEMIDASGYSIDDLKSMESAFEIPRKAKEKRKEWIYDGAMAVMDTLATIHKVDGATLIAKKALFAKN